MSELDDMGRPLDEAGVAKWWQTWGLDHMEARLKRLEAYAKQKAETEEVMRARKKPA